MQLTEEDLIVVEGALEANIRSIKGLIKEGQERGQEGETYLHTALRYNEETYKKVKGRH